MNITQFLLMPVLTQYQLLAIAQFKGDKYAVMLKCCFYITAGFSDGDDDDGSHSLISTAASSRVSTAKSRASSARPMMLGTRRWSGTVGSSNPSSASSKKTNAWASTGDDEKQEKIPPLVPSLFPHISPTIYFSVEGEKGKLNIKLCILHFEEVLFSQRHKL